jgi:hypothetical protein
MGEVVSYRVVFIRAYIPGQEDQHPVTRGCGGMAVCRIDKTVIVETVDECVQKTVGAAVQVESDEGTVLYGRGCASVTSQLAAHEASVILNVVPLSLGHGCVFRGSFRCSNGRGKPLAELVWRKTLCPPVLLETREAG